MRQVIWRRQGVGITLASAAQATLPLRMSDAIVLSRFTEQNGKIWSGLDHG